MRSRASASGSSRSRRRPSAFSAVSRTGPAAPLEPRRRPPRRTSRGARARSGARARPAGTSSPTISRRWRVCGLQRRSSPGTASARLGQLERANDAPAVVADGCRRPRSGRAPPGERSARPGRRRIRAPVRSLSGRRRRREREVCERCAQVQAGATATTASPGARRARRSPRAREAAYSPTDALVRERPDRHEPRRARRLVRQDRQPAIDLHGVRGDDLGAEPVGERLGDRGLARRRRPEDGDHARRASPVEPVRPERHDALAPRSVVEVASVDLTSTRSPAAPSRRS